MVTATLNLYMVAKRILSKTEAAHYCGMMVKRFEIDCPVRPIRYPNGDLRWDTRDLDHWLDGLKDSLDQNDTTESMIERLR